MNRTTLSISAVVGAILALGIVPCVAFAEHLDAKGLFESHCFDCHGHGAAEGSLALDELLAAKDSPAVRSRWHKVWKMVRQGFMPPVDAEPLPHGDRRAMTQWIEQQALGVDYTNRDPGRVTMRRLNRMEYEYTVNDLFGLNVTVAEELSSLSPGQDARLSDLLPPDDTAYGFDNIGDFQTLSPALLEKYFDVAELVVSKIIVPDGPWYPSTRVDPASIAVERDDAAKRVVQLARFDVAETGEYRVDVSFYLGGWQEYGGGFEFELSFDDQPIAAKLIDVGGQETHRFARDGQLSAGEHVLKFVTTAVKPNTDGNLVPLELRPKISVTGPIDPDRRTYPESHRRIFFAGEPADDPAARRQYAREILGRVAFRAFRRPVDDATLDRLTTLALSDEDFEHGIANGLLAILTSPRFLFRTELQPQPDDPTSRHELDEYALASRLSYLLWLSLPDEELIQLAFTGKLRQALPGQVRRMLADPKSGRFFEDFVGQWLRTRNVLMTPISRHEDEIDPVRGLMKRETEMLFEHIARNDLDLIELVTADYSFLNKRLARFYGIPNVNSDSFRRVSLAAETHRGGVLTHGSFLVSTSNPDRTSPVKRGLFVLENLLATQPPAPPANVPPLEDAKVAGKRRATVREQLEMHRSDPACAACHAHFDPIGIVLENYDLLGKWRDEERGAVVDPTATTVSGENLAGIDDLRNYVAANRERYYRCVTEKLLTYALGRGLEPYDAVTVDEITAELTANGGKFSTLLTEVVASPAFQLRRGDDDSELDTAALAAIPDIPPPDKRRPDPRMLRRRQRERERRRAAEQREQAAAAAAAKSSEQEILP